MPVQHGTCTLRSTARPLEGPWQALLESIKYKTNRLPRLTGRSNTPHPIVAHNQDGRGGGKVTTCSSSYCMFLSFFGKTRSTIARVCRSLPLCVSISSVQEL